MTMLSSSSGVKPLSVHAPAQSDKRHKASSWFVAVTVVACVVQLWWFASKCFNEIDIDGMGYLGIARHLRQGEFHAAINAFRSPLISWLIAVGSLGSAATSAGYLHIGKLINIGAFLLSLVLLYVLTCEAVAFEAGCFSRGSNIRARSRPCAVCRIGSHT